MAILMRWYIPAQRCQHIYTCKRNVPDHVVMHQIRTRESGTCVCVFCVFTTPCDHVYSTQRCGIHHTPHPAHHTHAHPQQPQPPTNPCIHTHIHRHTLPLSFTVCMYHCKPGLVNGRFVSMLHMQTCNVTHMIKPGRNVIIKNGMLHNTRS